MFAFLEAVGQKWIAKQVKRLVIDASLSFQLDVLLRQLLRRPCMFGAVFSDLLDDLRNQLLCRGLNLEPWSLFDHFSVSCLIKLCFVRLACDLLE